MSWRCFKGGGQSLEEVSFTHSGTSIQKKRVVDLSWLGRDRHRRGMGELVIFPDDELLKKITWIEADIDLVSVCKRVLVAAYGLLFDKSWDVLRDSLLANVFDRQNRLVSHFYTINHFTNPMIRGRAQGFHNGFVIFFLKPSLREGVWNGNNRLSVLERTNKGILEPSGEIRL